MEFIKKLLPLTIILGLTSIILVSTFGLENQLAYKETLNGITYYRFNVKLYLDNVVQGWNTDALNFLTIIPSRQWIAEWSNASEWWTAFVNNLAVVFNYLYFPVNFILYPLRWVAYVIQGLLAMIGWPVKPTGNLIVGWNEYTQTQEYTSTLITIIEWVKANLYIPYI